MAIVRWPRFSKTHGWLFMPKFTVAHFAEATAAGNLLICRSVIVPFGEGYDADGDFPRCKNCLRILNSGRRVFEADEALTELWSGCIGSTKRHYFKFERGAWRSACGVVRSACDMLDGAEHEKCAKCVNYTKERL